MPLPHGDILQLAALIASNPQMASAYGTPMGGLQGPAVAPPVAVPVPGQNAQAVMPGGMQMPQPEMPVDQRIDQGFADAGMAPSPQNQPNFVGQIMAALQGNAPAATTGTHDGGGLLSGLLPEGVGNFLGDAAYGAASADPTASPLSTLATAFAGAQGAKNTRLDRKRAENAAAEDRRYARGRDARSDAREDEKLAIDRAKAGAAGWAKLDDDTLFNPTTGETRDMPSGRGPAGGVKFSDVTAIRKEIQDLPSYKSYQLAVPAVNSMAQAMTRDTRASDLDFIYAMARVFDPNSVVREGEMVLVNDTQSLPDQVIGYINGVNGGQRLTPESRTALWEAAKGRMTEYKSSLDADLGSFRGIAERYNINPDDIIPSVVPITENAAAGPAAEGTTFDDESTIPEGATVRDERGNLLKKQGGKLVPVL